jgi:hypothetical protein
LWACFFSPSPSDHLAPQVIPAAANLRNTSKGSIGSRH